MQSATWSLSAEAARVANFLAVIGGENFDGAAHFVEARTDALAHALRQGIIRSPESASPPRAARTAGAAPLAAASESRKFVVSSVTRFSL